MSIQNPARCTWLAFAAAVFVATLSQCGKGGESGDVASPDARPLAQDPVAITTPPPDAIRILISGSMQGRLEPCGCASGQLGGLARRMQHIGEQRTYDLLLEGGDLVEANNELQVLKLFTMSTVLFAMERPYDALGVGLQDLALPREEWSAFLGAAPVVTTNLTSSEPDWPGRPFVDKEIRTHRVRIASLLLPELPASASGEDAKVQRTDPVAAWQATFADTDPALLRIAMLHGDDAQIRAIVAQLDPSPDLAIGVDSAYIEPNSTPTMIGGVPLVYTGTRGRVLLDARLWREGERSRVVCELVPLAGSKSLPGGGGDPAVRDVLLEHRRSVKEQGVLERMAEQQPTPNGDSYVGNATCTGCHPSAAKVWAESKHAHAWQTLVDAENDPKRYGWPVTAYPDCVDCHVVGYGEQTGFVSYDATPQLADVGCERCHGPGSGHVTTAGKQKMGIIGGLAASVMCMQCHDYEQSPQFVYNERWAPIEHGREPK